MKHMRHSPVTAVGLPNRRGLWLSTFALAVLALAPFMGGCANANHSDRGESVTPADLPQQVRDGLDRATVSYPAPLAGAKWSRTEQFGGIDDSFYRLKGTNGRGRTIELEVTRAGRVIEVEESGVPLAEVPAPVITGLKGRIPSAKPDKVVAIYQAGNLLPIGYGFRGQTAEGQVIEAYITADGKAFLN